jgi:hypothetical protein
MERLKLHRVASSLLVPSFAEDLKIINTKFPNTKTRKAILIAFYISLVALLIFIDRNCGTIFFGTLLACMDGLRPQKEPLEILYSFFSVSLNLYYNYNFDRTWLAWKARRDNVNPFSFVDHNCSDQGTRI